jgi:hypothetical protein
MLTGAVQVTEDMMGTGKDDENKENTQKRTTN